MTENSPKEIRNQLFRFFVDELGVEPEYLDGGEPLFSTGRLESIDFVITMTFIRDHFGSEISLEKQNFNYLDTLNGIVETVSDSLNGK
ncbi:MAG: acyl carrier protein [Proteobacteria bacterium]|nr:acyl carrier protein [Pseudomonadota bacterium]